MKQEAELTGSTLNGYDGKVPTMSEDREAEPIVKEVETSNPPKEGGKSREKDSRSVRPEEDSDQSTEKEDKKEKKQTHGEQADSFFESLQKVFTSAEQRTDEGKEAVDAQSVLQLLHPDKQIKKWDVIDYAIVLGTLNDIGFDKGAERVMRKELFSLAKEYKKDTDLIEAFAAGNEPGEVEEALPATQRVYANIHAQMETLSPEQLEILRQEWVRHKNPEVASPVLQMIAEVQENPSPQAETPPMKDKTMNEAVHTLFSSDFVAELSSSGEHNVLGGLFELAAGQAASRWDESHYRKLLACLPTAGLGEKEAALVSYLKGELHKFSLHVGIISEEEATKQEAFIEKKEEPVNPNEPFTLFAQNMEITLERLGPEALALWQKDWETFKKHAEVKGDINAADAIGMIVERIKQEKERKQQLLEEMKKPVEVQEEPEVEETKEKETVVERREQQEKIVGQLKLLEAKIADVTNPELKKHLEALLAKLKDRNNPFARWTVAEMQAEYTALLTKISALSAEMRKSNDVDALEQERSLRRDTMGYQDLLVKRLQRNMSPEEWLEFSKQAAKSGEYQNAQQQAAAEKYVALQTVDPLQQVNLGALSPDFQNVGVLAQQASAARSVGQLNQIRDSFSQLMNRELLAGNQLGPEEQNLMSLLNYRISELGARGEYIFELEEPPYPEEDKPLYEGEIDDVITERFKRILFGRPGVASPTDPNEVQRLTDLQITDEKRRDYYEDIQEWVRVVLRNDANENPGQAKKLHLVDSRRQRFKSILTRDARTVDPADLQRDIEYLQDMNGGRLTRYFLHHENAHARVGNLEGIKFISKNLRREKLSRGGLPESLEETMILIEDQYGAEYPEIRTGGEYELLDKYGNFHYENFIYWTRQRVNWMKDENPTSEINPLGQINLRTGITQLNLMEILYTPQYLQYSPIEIIGDETRDPDSIQAGWSSKKQDHPDMLGRSVSSRLLYELAWLGREHNQSAAYYQIRGDKKSWQEQLRKVNIDNYLTRGDHFLDFQCKLASHKEGRKEYDAYYREGAEGSVGKAIRGTIGANFLLTEFTTYFKNNETGEVKPFNDNAFYKYLAPNGASSFLLGIAEKSLGMHGGVSGKYKEFVSKRIEAAAQDFRRNNPTLSTDQLTELDRLRESYRRLLADSQTSINVGFENAVGTILTENGRQQNVSFLVDFRTQVEQRILGKRLSKVDRETIKETVKNHDLLPHLKSGFFDNIKSLFNNNELNAAIDAFTPEQIRFFDYDPKNPPAGFDPKNPEQNADFKRYFGNTEKMALTIANVLHKIGRREYVHGKLGERPGAELNYFASTRYNQKSEAIIDHAFQKSLIKIFDLSSVDANYAYLWGKTFLWTTGVAALNDTEAIGFDFWCKLLRFKEWNLRQKEERSLGTNNMVADEIRALSMTWWEMMRLSKGGESKVTVPMIDIILGGDGDHIKPMAECTMDGGFSFPANAQSDFVNNHVGASVPTFENLTTKHFMLAEALYTDINGNLVFDHGKAHEAINGWWRNYKYTTAQNDQNMNDRTRRNGRTIRQWDNWLGPRATGEINNAIIKEYGKADHAKAGFLSILGAEIRERHHSKGEYPQITINKLKEIEAFLAHKFGKGELEESWWSGSGTHYHVHKGFVTSAVFNAMLRSYGTSYRWMYWNEFIFGQGVGALTAGFSEAFKEFVKHIIPKS